MKIGEFVFPLLKYKRTRTQLGAWAAIGTFVIVFLVTVAIDLHADVCRTGGGRYCYRSGHPADSWMFNRSNISWAITERHPSLIIRAISWPIENGILGGAEISMFQLMQRIWTTRLGAYAIHSLKWLGVLTAVLVVQVGFVIGFVRRRYSRLDPRWIWPAVKCSMLASQTWVVLMGVYLTAALLIHLLGVTRHLDSIPILVYVIGLALVGISVPVGVWTLTALQAAPLVRGPVDETLCKKCGYSLLGLTEPRCPECGQAFEAAKLEGLNAAAIAVASGGVEKS